MEWGPAIVSSCALPLKACNGALDNFFSELLTVAGNSEVIREPRQNSSFDLLGKGAGGVPEPPDGLNDHSGHLHIVRHGTPGQDDSVI